MTENKEESKVIQMEGMSKTAEKAAVPSEEQVKEEPVEEEKAVPCMKLTVVNNRTDKKSVISSRNNLGLNWGYHNADQSLLVITQIMPGTVKNAKGEEYPNWIPVAHLKDHSIVGFQFGG
jgi:hypothetical protein